MGHFKNSFRRIQKCHQRPQKRHGRPGKHQAHSQIQYHHARDGLPQLFVVMGPKALGDHNAIAAVESIGKIDEQRIQGSRGPDGRDAHISQAAAHHHGIHHAVELLKNVADKQRDCKAQNQPNGIPLGHVPHTKGVLFHQPTSFLCFLSDDVILRLYTSVATTGQL